MNAAGVTIFAQQDHVLLEELGLRRAPGRGSSHHCEEPSEVTWDQPCHEGLRPLAPVFLPGHALHGPVGEWQLHPELLHLGTQHPHNRLILFARDAQVGCVFLEPPAKDARVWESPCG